MSHDLEILKQHRDALLLAEAAAWLHDMGKCADEHIVHEASDCPPNHKYDYKTAQSHLLPSPVPNVNLLDETASIKDLIEQGMPRIISDKCRPWKLRTLGRCHAAAHVEKEETDRSGKQPQNDTRLAQAFGFESAALGRLTERLQSLPYANLTNRNEFGQAVQKAFNEALGDTRRPENEVTLWDWSSTVAALYKAALGGALLDYQPQPDDLQWRLLSVRVDSAAFLGHAARLPDLLARQELLRSGLERVRELLEEEYPLATRVYQDENASIYVVPNLNDLLERTNGEGNNLRDLIHAKFAEGTVKDNAKLALAGEMVAEVELDSRVWQAQRPDRTSDVPPIAEMLNAPLSTHADAKRVAEQWKDAVAEICPVCGLRPQGPSPKAKDRKVCDVCEQRRADRSQEWATQRPHTTMWTDEVADDNGRLALVVGQFDLEHWLDGTLVQSLTVTDPAQDSTSNKANVARKNPSFARLRRVWETTRAFWQETLPTEPERDLATSLVGKVVGSAGPRLEIIPANRDGLDLGPFHTYELVINGVHLSVVWGGDHGCFITCDNLDYLQTPEQLGGAPVADIVKPGDTFPLEEPVGYGGRNKVWGTIAVEEVRPLAGTYTPAIPILAEPRTFMALVPADKALAVVQAIKTEYEQRMGKVRNRLPLTLGVVYAHRRTPLAAILDAGRRMLRRPTWEPMAEVTAVAPLTVTDTTWPTARQVTLRLDEREITVAVPTVMGDGKTHDVWYPYWQVAGKPTDRTRWFAGPDGEHWVHVCDLRPGDTFAFTPSTFDFEYLDTAGRRFEVAYDGEGRRRGPTRRQRPYLLEEIDTLEQAWREIRRLTLSQIHAVEALIEGKRRAWEQPTGTLEVSPAFRQFVSDVLREAHIHSEALERAALIGLLADALEIHLTVHKEKPQSEEA